MNQNLPLYHIFNCVAENENISRAAKQLFISQPAVSKAISNLEESLQVTLFIRNSRGVKLTDEGKLLYEHTRIAFDALSKAEENIIRIHDLGIGHLRIGASTTLCKYLLLPYLDGFVKENPHIKITIDNQSSSHTLKQLENCTLDIGLVAKPENGDAFHFLSLDEIEDIFVATHTYLNNLTLRENSSDIFSNANIMLLDESNVTRKYVDQYFKSNNIEPKHVLEISTMDLLIEFAKTSLGVACVIKAFVESELREGTLVQIPVTPQLNKREVGFCYSKNAYLSDSMHKFMDYIRKSS
ncbi:LysR family transcriptional regulator [Lachnospiraceae bacterium MD1]|uniref:LysR family transcriptional regulator n=1 Tax=Variimorphobacter saccharofermentans TaxID=2755051 RepID=A0A839JXT3_9FIRM|nr:LysR family transcriptional regulator [Variimorphobacter saccharofermentans]MBB2182240.1 LysR family transcriptional regulator [Variimorphobacter saccharofermentans]